VGQTAGTRRPTVAGVLCIVSGAFIAWFSTGRFIRSIPESGFLSQWHYLGLVAPVIGLVAIGGGISATRRRAWGSAVAGGVCAVYPPHDYGWLIWTPLLGIVAVGLLMMSKAEFTPADRHE